MELLCENALMGSIIDRFGEDVAVQIFDRAHFKKSMGRVKPISQGLSDILTSTLKEDK